jgi:hypothetical protein
MRLAQAAVWLGARLLFFIRFAAAIRARGILARRLGRTEGEAAFRKAAESGRQKTPLCLQHSDSELKFVFAPWTRDMVTTLLCAS